MQYDHNFHLMILSYYLHYKFGLTYLLVLNDFDKL